MVVKGIRLTSLKSAGLSVSRWFMALASIDVLSPPEVETSKDLEKNVTSLLLMTSSKDAMEMCIVRECGLADFPSKF